MKLALGCAMLARGRAGGHADGIAVYTDELLRELSSSPRSGVERVQPVVYGARWAAALPGALALPLPYRPATIVAAATGLPFAGTAALERGIDLFHAPDHHIPRLHRVPVLATVMDVIPLRHPEWVRPRLRAFKSAMFRRAVGWAAHLVTISEFARGEICDCLGVPPERVSVTPLGVNEAFYTRVDDATRLAVLARHGIDRPGFIFVGTLQPRKNIARLVRAHASLPAQVRREHPLWVIGEDGWRSEEIRAELAAMQAEGRGRWLRGVPREDLHALLQSSLALVFPSLSEGFGLPVLEAFASSLPVVTAGTTSLPEVGGDAAVYVDPTSQESIAAGMLRIAEDAALRGDLVTRGLQRAREFTWERTVSRTAEVYRALA